MVKDSQGKKKIAKIRAERQFPQVSHKKKGLGIVRQVLPGHENSVGKIDQHQFPAFVFEKIAPPADPASQVAHPAALERGDIHQIKIGSELFFVFREDSGVFLPFLSEGKLNIFGEIGPRRPGPTQGQSAAHFG
jgi:hypothetical protein